MFGLHAAHLTGSGQAHVGALIQGRWTPRWRANAAACMLTPHHCCLLLLCACWAAPLQRRPAGAGVHLGMLLPQARLMLLPCSSIEASFVHVALTGIQHTDDWPLLSAAPVT